MKDKSVIVCYLISLLTLGACANLKAQNTYTIKGNIIDEKGVTIPGVTLFLTGTQRSTASETNGDFHIAGVGPGTYQLVAKMIGFKTGLYQVSITKQGVTLQIQLQPDLVLLKEVKIKPNEEWFENLAIFKKKFLGETANTGQCKMLNAEVLSFDYDKKTKKLKANSTELLIIKNQALGYKVKYLLEKFEYDGYKDVVEYDGYPFFEVLKGTPQEEAIWKINRELAYHGSIHHFIHTVYNKTFKAEGFVVYKVKNRAALGERCNSKYPITIDYHVVKFDSLLTKHDENSLSLFYRDALYIIYTKEKEPEDYLSKGTSIANLYLDRNVAEGQISIINLTGPIIIDNKGSFNPIFNVFFEGYMAYEKIGDLLPYDFTSKE